jgi:hypothetical protein
MAKHLYKFILNDEHKYNHSTITTITVRFRSRNHTTATQHALQDFQPMSVIVLKLHNSDAARPAGFAQYDYGLATTQQRRSKRPAGFSNNKDEG